MFFCGCEIHFEFATQNYLRTSKMLEIFSSSPLTLTSHSVKAEQRVMLLLLPASPTNQPSSAPTKSTGKNSQIISYFFWSAYLNSHNILGSSILTGLQGSCPPARPSCQLFYCLFPPSRPLNREDDWEGGSYSSAIHRLNATLLHQSNY